MERRVGRSFEGTGKEAESAQDNKEVGDEAEETGGGKELEIEIGARGEADSPGGREVIGNGAKAGEI